MTRRLVPSTLIPTPDFDPVADYPEDVGRLVAAATNAGYKLTPRDAAELWQRHAGEVCASWFAVTGDDQDILAVLFKHADVLPDEVKIPPPPEGYTSWLDFAVDTMNPSTEELECLFAGNAPTTRQSMRDAVRAELVALKRKAGEL